MLGTFIRQEAANHSDDFNCGYTAGFHAVATQWRSMFPTDTAQSSEYKEAWARGSHDASQLEEQDEDENE